MCADGVIVSGHDWLIPSQVNIVCAKLFCLHSFRKYFKYVYMKGPIVAAFMRLALILRLINNLIFN